MKSTSTSFVLFLWHSLIRTRNRVWHNQPFVVTVGFQISQESISEYPFRRSQIDDEPALCFRTRCFSEKKLELYAVMRKFASSLWLQRIKRKGCLDASSLCDKPFLTLSNEKQCLGHLKRPGQVNKSLGVKRFKG